MALLTASLEYLMVLDRNSVGNTCHVGGVQELCKYCS